MLKGPDLAVIWFGAGINIVYMFIASSILLPNAGFWNTLIAIVIATTIAGVPFALAGYVGVEKGVTAMVGGRPAFGIRGSYILSVINASTCVGFTAICTIISATSLNIVVNTLTGFSNLVLMISIISLIQWLFTLSGYRPSWKWLERIMCLTLALLLGLAMLVVILNFNLVAGIASITGTGMPLAVAIDIAIGAGPISWATYVSDYTRHSKAGSRSSIGWVYLGFVPAAIWTMLVGVITGAATGSYEPSIIMATLGLGIPALMIIVLSAITTNFLDIYSGSVSIMNLSPKLNLKIAVSIVAALSWIIALIPGFVENFEQFLFMVAYTLGPWVSIVLVDFFLINRRYEPIDLFESKKFWYWRGFNYRALLAWAIGVVVFFTFEYTWLVNYSPAALPSLSVSALVYYALSKNRSTC